MSVALTFQDTEFDVIDRDGVPWLRASQIGLALGYGQRGAQIDHTLAARSINNLYNRHADEFSESMTSVVRLHHQIDDAGQMREVRIFSPRGFHLLAMMARTPKAKTFRVWALDIIDRYGVPKNHALYFSPEEQAILSRMPQSHKLAMLDRLADVSKEGGDLNAYLGTALRMYIATADRPALEAAQPEPRVVTAFWQAWEHLEQGGHIRNHSASPALIAVNLPEFIRVAREQGYYSFDRAELCRLLPQSRRFGLLKSNKTTTSVVARKSVKCWVFQRSN